jgi:hypothetical protein
MLCGLSHECRLHFHKRGFFGSYLQNFGVLEAYIVTISTGLPPQLSYTYSYDPLINRLLTSLFLPARASKSGQTNPDTKCDAIICKSRVRIRKTTGDFSESSYLQNLVVAGLPNVSRVALLR